MSVFTKDNLALQDWWIHEIEALLDKVVKTEEKRTARLKANAEKQMGEDFRTYTDIQDAYGMGIITERKRDRLMDLLEQSKPEPDRLYPMKLDMLGELLNTARRVIEDLEFREDET